MNADKVANFIMNANAHNMIDVSKAVKQNAIEVDKINHTQFIFDKVSKHLLEQDEKSTSGIHCVYFDGDNRCAIGCLLNPKKLTVSNIEDYSLQDDELINSLNASLGFKLSQIDMSLLLDLREVHDNYNTSEWKDKLDFIASEYDLNINYE